MELIHYTSSQGSGAIAEEGQKELRGQRQGWLTRKCLLDTSKQLNISTAVVTAWTRFVQAQDRPKPNMERGIGHEIPPLPKELLAVVSCWKRVGQFSPRVYT